MTRYWEMQLIGDIGAVEKRSLKRIIRNVISESTLVNLFFVNVQIFLAFSLFQQAFIVFLAPHQKRRQNNKCALRHSGDSNTPRTFTVAPYFIGPGPVISSPSFGA
jgi:hypothetical protein